MWDLPRPGLEPVSPALAGGFLTTVPPGKSQKHFFFKGEKIIGENFFPPPNFSTKSVPDFLLLSFLFSQNDF